MGLCGWGDEFGHGLGLCGDDLNVGCTPATQKRVWMERDAEENGSQQHEEAGGFGRGQSDSPEIKERCARAFGLAKEGILRALSAVRSCLKTFGFEGMVDLLHFGRGGLEGFGVDGSRLE